MRKTYSSILSPEIKDFLAMRRESESKSTHDHDAQILEHLDRYLCKIGCDNKEIDEQQVTGWINTLTGKTSSIANKVIVVRKFFDFLSGYGLRPFIPRIPKVHDDYAPYIFSDEELSCIFKLADSIQPGKSNIKYTMLHVQMPMILRMMYGCGLRIGETLALKMQDVDLDTGLLILRHSKGDKQRIVPMHPSLTAILGRYCCTAGLIGDADAFLFGIPNSDASIPPHGARSRFERLLKNAGISLPGRKKHERGPCLHCLRHVFAFKSFARAESEGIRIDDAVPYLSIFLGHDSLKETEKYLKFSAEMFPDAMNRFESFTSDIFPEVHYEE